MKRKIIRVANIIFAIILASVVFGVLNEIIVSWGAREDSIFSIIAVIPSIYVGYLVWRYPLLSFFRDGERMITIHIPKEHQHLIQNPAYVSLWKNHSLLVFNENEHKHFKCVFGNLEGENKGMRAFVHAGMEQCVVQDGKIKIPARFEDHLEGNSRKFYEHDKGLVIK